MTGPPHRGRPGLPRTAFGNFSGTTARDVDLVEDQDRADPLGFLPQISEDAEPSIDSAITAAGSSACSDMISLLPWMAS
jgi:hypothetical protein